jgi:predicted nucleic acid-binding protein
LPDAATKLDYAAALGIESIPVKSLWKGALARSVEKTVAVYDTLFIELADRERVPVATFDGPVLKAFPTTARRPQELVMQIRGTPR